jgi:transposase
MAQSKRKQPPAAHRLPPQLEAVNLHAAGIDVGAFEHWVAVPQGADPQPVRRFGGCTADLEALADWLAACGVRTVAMESTGVFWVPLFELLESRGFEVRLVDARQVHQVAGRPKGDVYDCQWLQRLHTFGLLASAFRPAEQVCVLRGYLRQRAMLVAYASRHVQHMQKALTQMNVKLQHVVSDVTGATGMAIIRAILAGQRDPARLARRRDRRCKQDEAAIARALRGTGRPEHLFALRQAVELYDFYNRQIAECDRQVEAQRATFADRSGGAALPPRARPGRRRTHSPAFDARGRLYRVCGVDLTVVEGIDGPTALTLVSEVGTDRSRWPGAKHFCSWLGLCPRHRVSGGKVLSRRTKPCANRAALALRLAAGALHHSQSALGAFFRRLKSRLGAPQAITATAHQLARLVYALLKHGTAYVSQAMDEYEQKYRARAVKGLCRKARELGYELVERGGRAPGATPVAAAAGQG